MPTTIAKAHANQGYVTAIDFFNAESTSPTPGDHEQLVSELFDNILSQDYFFFLLEMYSDEDTYSGPLVIFQNQLMILDGGGLPVCLQTDPQIVDDLFTIDPTTGLTQFFSGEIALADDSGTPIGSTLSVYRSVTYGAERWLVQLKDNLGVPSLTGVISSKIVDDSVLSCYNVKVDALPFEVLTLRAARNYYQNFTIRVGENEKQNFSYKTMGQVMYVADNEFSRKDVKRLVSAGVIFANI